jgi:VanZ family protein
LLKWLAGARNQALLWALLVLALTLSPSDLLPNIPQWTDLLSWDKLAHAALFGIQSWLITRALLVSNAHRFSSKTIAVIGAACGMIFGFCIELAQYALPIGRSGNLYDFLADVAGSLASWAIFQWMARNKG